MNKGNDTMNNNNPSTFTFASTARASRPALGPILAPMLALALLLLPRAGAAEDHSGWSFNMTPVVLLPKNEYRFGGGTDPELKYTLDLGGARLSAGGRVGGYYARNQFGVTLMPTVRLMVPIGAVEPYLSVGMGYGWLPRTGHADFVTMSRIGFVYRFSKNFAIGLEGTVQNLDGSDHRWPSFGSMMSFDL
jgi:hypothetical protein